MVQTEQRGEFRVRLLSEEADLRSQVIPGDQALDVPGIGGVEVRPAHNRQVDCAARRLAERRE